MPARGPENLELWPRSTLRSQQSPLFYINYYGPDGGLRALTLLTPRSLLGNL